jgi:hypothetical protein
MKRELMKPEYNFKKGERGKFHRSGATLQIPVYLEPDVLAFLSERAERKGVEVDQMVNDLLKRDIGIIEIAES